MAMGGDGGESVDGELVRMVGNGWDWWKMVGN